MNKNVKGSNSNAFNTPLLLVCNKQGEIFEIPHLLMTGTSVSEVRLPTQDELIPMPDGSELFILPGRRPIGFDPVKNELVTLTEYQGEEVFAVAAFVAPAHMQFLHASFLKLEAAVDLPIFCYTAVGWRKNKFYVTAIRVDEDERQDAKHFNNQLITKNANSFLKKYSHNRLVVHLIENCVKQYCCPAARNYVMSRWEAPLPSSPGCNSRCVGCISEQSKDSGITSPQHRLTFIPTPDEIAEIAVSHLENAPKSVVSFGQGCEGEPLMVADVLEAAIILIRNQTSKGIINLNSNASRPDKIESLCRAGLDSLRISINSFQPHYYNQYYRPVGYQFNDVIESLKMARKYNKWVSLNYFIFPGFTDLPSEMNALENIIQTHGINLIQARNFNFDPQLFITKMGLNSIDEKPIGLINWYRHMRNKYPQVHIGYFNPHNINKDV